MFPPRVFYQSPRLRGAMTEIEAQAYAFLTKIEDAISTPVILAAPAPPAPPPPIPPGRYRPIGTPLLH